ncbi:MAG TPA: DUF4838 domain-containing protein, partial [Candidatus Binataceae bacterium]|nr:DUF4838 domain-containing protein [Candidatus Binataceae bacterium]
MGVRGLNAFSYIRNTVDNRLKVEEMVEPCRERGIASEYGGHVLQLLMPRERFAERPEFFPVGSSGRRNPRGNLCVSNVDAMRVVRDGAIRYVEENPEGEMLHLWGTDVSQGAWCRCGDCAALSPQRQYMEVVNAVAGELALREAAPPVAYLAYHDTIAPDPALRPLPNVWFEWAPRERCYGHSIDDPACEVNPRYFETLKRYLDLFDGRGHVFEYYADAILFGGIAAATPAVIAADLRAYRALGVAGVSCLTFGAHSALAYPVNLEAFARATRSPDFDPDAVLADTVHAIHPACAAAMTAAYKAIARASALLLAVPGDMMRPKSDRRTNRIVQLRAAAKEFALAISAADSLIAAGRGEFNPPELAVWHYSREVVSGIGDYLTAADATGAEERSRVDGAIGRIAAAIHQLRAEAPALRDTWAAYDLEWIGETWLKRLRTLFDQGSACEERR